MINEYSKQKNKKEDVAETAAIKAQDKALRRGRATEKEQLGAAKRQKRDNKLAKTDDFLWKDVAAMKARLDTHAKVPDKTKEMKSVYAFMKELAKVCTPPIKLPMQPQNQKHEDHLKFWTETILAADWFESLLKANRDLGGTIVRSDQGYAAAAQAGAGMADQASFGEDIINDNLRKAEQDTQLRSSLSKKHRIEDGGASSGGEDDNNEEEERSALAPAGDVDGVEVEE